MLFVSEKTYHRIKAALFIQYFNLGIEYVAHAMMTAQCRNCRKSRIIVKVMTIWYNR